MSYINIPLSLVSGLNITFNEKAAERGYQQVSDEKSKTPKIAIEKTAERENEAGFEKSNELTSNIASSSKRKSTSEPEHQLKKIKSPPSIAPSIASTISSRAGTVEASSTRVFKFKDFFGESRDPEENYIDVYDNDASNLSNGIINVILCRAVQGCDHVLKFPVEFAEKLLAKNYMVSCAKVLEMYSIDELATCSIIIPITVGSTFYASVLLRSKSHRSEDPDYLITMFQPRDQTHCLLSKTIAKRLNEVLCQVNPELSVLKARMLDIQPQGGFYANNGVYSVANTIGSIVKKHINGKFSVNWLKTLVVKVDKDATGIEEVPQTSVDLKNRADRPRPKEKSITTQSTQDRDRRTHRLLHQSRQNIDADARAAIQIRQ